VRDITHIMMHVAISNSGLLDLIGTPRAACFRAARRVRSRCLPLAPVAACLSG